MPNEHYRIPLYIPHQSLHPSLPLIIKAKRTLPILTYYTIPNTKSKKEASVAYEEYNALLQQQHQQQPHMKEANYKQINANEKKNYSYYFAHPVVKVCY